MSTTSTSLRAPTGSAIVGTFERLTGTALITTPIRKPDGTIAFDWDGGTEVDWDLQETETFDGETVFVDEYGNKWLGRELVNDNPKIWVLVVDDAKGGTSIELHPTRRAALESVANAYDISLTLLDDDEASQKLVDCLDADHNHSWFVLEEKEILA